MKPDPGNVELLDAEGKRILRPGERADERSRYADEWRKDPALRGLELLARWLDSIFQIPGLNVRFGLDALAGLIPGLGDTATAFASLYILVTAARRGVSRVTMTRMATNVAIDYLVGCIPFIGDVFDVYWKANQKNVELLRRYADANPAGERRLRIQDWLFVGGLAVLLLTLLVGSMTITYFMATWIIRLVRGH